MTAVPVTRAYGNVSVTFYYLDAGDRVPRHSHPHQHTTRVLVGRARVDLFADPPQGEVMTRLDPDVMLPPNIEHEITALNDGTVVMNVVALDDLPPPGPPAAAGGVMMACGCVVQP